MLINSFQESIVVRDVLAHIDPGVLGALIGVRGSDAFARDLLGFVSLMKQNLVHPDALVLATVAGGSDRLRALAAAYKSYQERLSAAGMVDFRDLITEAIELVQSKDGLRELLRAKFRLILVDEFQDVDPAQFQLLQLLAPPASRPRLVVVGDPDQSIYGFRGTVPRLLGIDFPAVYGAATVSLDECWRCPQDALDARERLLDATHPGLARRDLLSVARVSPPSVVVAHDGDPLAAAFVSAPYIKRIH